MKQVLARGGRIVVEDVPVPVPRDGEVLVRVVRSCISAGTESAGLDGGSLLGRAIRHPERVKEVAGHVLRHGVVATAPGRDCDFVSRFFAPAAGIDEDPVTGASHTRLVPYWAKQLGKHRLFARQVSARGGELWCELKGDRVVMAGHVAPYLEGTIEV